jgi:hypothetical protein
MQLNCYSILNINPKANLIEIKKAYLKKIHAIHPDKGGSQKECARLNNAYKEAMENYQNKIDFKKNYSLIIKNFCLAFFVSSLVFSSLYLVKKILKK